MDFSGVLGVQKVDAADTFQYHCTRCGECCHNVKDAIMLSTYDLFQIARHLSIEMEEVIEKYTDPIPLTEYNFPILMVKTKQHGDVCTFYKSGGCSIQDAKPLVCRLYPLNIGPENEHDLGYYIVSQKRHHFTGRTITVGDWMDANLHPDDRRFMTQWYNQAQQIGRIMRKKQSDMNNGKTKEFLFSIYLYMYFSYEINEEFWPQYVQNMDQLKRNLCGIV